MSAVSDASDSGSARGWRAAWRVVRGWLQHVVLLPVYLWRSTAALRAPRCRFHPSCSTYAVGAVRAHGAGRGTVLAMRRVGRCHPWNPGGFDHVPDASDRSAWRRRHTHASS